MSHILHEGNASADFMAVGGSIGIAAEYIAGNLPSELYNLIDYVKFHFSILNIRLA